MRWAESLISQLVNSAAYYRACRRLQEEPISSLTYRRAEFMQLLDRHEAICPPRVSQSLSRKGRPDESAAVLGTARALRGTEKMSAPPSS
jgi:hypothetical protein